MLIAWKAVDCQIAELTADERTIYMEDINRVACAMTFSFNVIRLLVFIFN